jgi:DNA-binding NarL/FixJ family response regulator
VKSHVRALLKNLGANSRTHAVAIALREGLLAT